jgi:hypothetical protein
VERENPFALSTQFLAHPRSRLHGGIRQIKLPRNFHHCLSEKLSVFAIELKQAVSLHEVYSTLRKVFP